MVAKDHTIEELEELVIKGKSPLTRMLALQKLKILHYNSVELAVKLQDIREILDR
jgi:hypothetical protein